MTYMRKIIFVLILAFLISCGAAGCVTRPGPVDIDIYKGSDGIVMEFLPNAPPNSAFEDSEFQIAVEISNEGAYDVIDGYLVLNLELAYMELFDWEWEEPITTISNNQANFDLEGKSEFNVFGERGIIRARIGTKSIEELIESHTTTVSLTTCYGYKTKANPSLCIDPDIFDLRKNKACTVKDVSLQDQGAPVAVTKIEVKMIGHEDKIEPQFLIYIVNKGNGQIIEKDSVERVCSAGALARDVFNTIHIKAVLSNRELECAPNPIKLTATKRYVKCSAKERDWIDKGELAYTSVLNIELDYGYTSTIAKEVKIEKIG